MMSSLLLSPVAREFGAGSWLPDESKITKKSGIRRIVNKRLFAAAEPEFSI
jgi:hypothetical protein